MENTTLRLQYTKTGNMKFISHLDVNRLFLRALRRAGFKPRYSEGFHPHPKFSFALPLSLGHESICELVDITLESAVFPREMMDRMNAVLPKDFQIHACDYAGDPLKHAKYAQYALTVRVKDDAAFSLMQKTLSGKIIVEKKTKSKVEKTDISPLIASLEMKQGEKQVLIRAKLSASPSSYLNPNYLYEALRANPDLAPRLEECTIMREAIYHKDGLLLSPMG